MKKLVLYTDGASRGNPGPAGIGALLYDEKGRVVAEISEYLGEAT
ncbi:MAG TPA: ribonuclease H, partial [Clostridia bacterium]|nr:ribonuclease H [Clostridia bacterium]